MGHVVNPTAFRLGRVIFWKFNFFHFRQNFLFNKYFLISKHFYKVIYWLFYSPSTINFFFNRFVRFYKKRKFYKKFIYYNLFSFKSLRFFLNKKSFYDIFFLKKKEFATAGDNVRGFLSKMLTFVPRVLYSKKKYIGFKNYLSNLVYLVKRRRTGLMRFGRKEYKLIKRRKKRYFWIFKRFLEKNITKLKHFLSLRYRIFREYNTLFFIYLCKLVSVCQFATIGVYKMFLLRYFLKKERRKSKYVFRNKFKNLLIKLELDSVIINIQNNLLQLNMMLFKEFWLDDFRLRVAKMFYFMRRTKKWRLEFFETIFIYLRLVLKFLKKKLYCNFTYNTVFVHVNRFNCEQFSKLVSFKKNFIFNVRKLWLLGRQRVKKIILKSFYKLFFSKRLNFILSNLFRRFYSSICFKLKFFFFNNSLMNAKTIFRFIFKQLTALRPINKIIYIVLLELRRTKLFKGFKILLRGRFTRRERAFSKVWISGQIPTSTITKKLDYYANHFISKFGIGSIRIWLYRGR